MSSIAIIPSNINTHLFDGSDYVPDRDNPRLTKQYERIFTLMSDAQWRTLHEISNACDAPQASVSAQLRHMRKPRFGGHTVDKRLREGSDGCWEYRLLWNEGR